MSAPRFVFTRAGTLRCLLAVLCSGLCTWGAPAAAQAQDAPALLELRFTPAPRAQLAIWLEDGQGRFLTTVGLTEAVAYRGIGNRPGASQMNSGYRWPYGRREGALPVWASRRAAAPGARAFERVIFQDRKSEGDASRSSSDYSVDNYYCLSFDISTTSRDALDAVSCASVFNSDKGRFLTQADIDAAYAEPYQEGASDSGRMVPLPLPSLYPPRMDLQPCSDGSGCFDHADVARYASHARAVMPEIDAVTMATPPGGVEQSVLYSVPEGWPAGDYRLLLEVNVEGDYNEFFNADSYPTPQKPDGRWDSWALGYGYPYRGQPSVVFEIPFHLESTGEQRMSTDAPIGRSSWDAWGSDPGALQSLDTIRDDPQQAPGSGADRLMRQGETPRLSLRVQTFRELPPLASDGGDGADPWMQILPQPRDDPDPSSQPVDRSKQEPDGADPGDAPSRQPETADAGRAGGEGASGEQGSAPSPDVVSRPDDEGEAVILPPEADSSAAVGPIERLRVWEHPDRLHAHEWVRLRFDAVRSELALHRYEVRVSTEPIEDAASFIRSGRPAKTATEDAEGAVSLMLPTDVGAGEPVEGEIGDLMAQTHYYVGVRAVDVQNRKGPISVAEVTTRSREFATVSPCFIATAAYGTPLAAEISVLRRFRDRFLLSHAPGRALVAWYYRQGPALAARLHAQPELRSWVRGLLSPLVRLARWLEPDRSEQAAANGIW